MSETKAEQAERRWLEIQAELNPGETEVGRTLSNIATKRAGWHKVRTEDGRYALFPDVPNYSQGSPEQRQLEDQWEQRSIAMHASQRAITVAPKPVENALAARVVRGD